MFTFPQVSPLRQSVSLLATVLYIGMINCSAFALRNEIYVFSF